MCSVDWCSTKIDIINSSSDVLANDNLELEKNLIKEKYICCNHDQYYMLRNSNHCTNDDRSIKVFDCLY